MTKWLKDFYLIVSILEYLKHKNFDVEVFMQSNGTLFDEERLKFLKKEGVATALSLDAFGETNDKILISKDGHSTFKKVDNSVNIMKSLGISTQINAVLSSENVGEIDRLFDYALLKDNIRGVAIDVLRNTGRAKAESIMEASLGETYKLMERIADKINIFHNAGIGIEFKDFSKMIYFLKNSVKRYAYCYAQTKESFVVTPSGELFPCSSFSGCEKYSMGNIQNGVLDIKVFDEIKELPKHCLNCEIRDYCAGACLAGKIFGNNGNDCVIKKYSYEYAKNFLGV